MLKRQHSPTLEENRVMNQGGARRALGIEDVEQIQALYPDYQIELREGNIVVMCPSDGVSGEVGMQFSRLLANWVYTHELGHVLGASAGFRLPNGDLRAPDVSFVSREQLKYIPRSFLSVVPEFIVEIKSSNDRLRELKEKIAFFLRQGVQVAVLVDPDTRTIYVYRLSKRGKVASGGKSLRVTTLHDGDTLTIPELFPGLEIPITSLWPVVYEE